MARTARKGLEYFPLDVTFFEDKKMQFVFARFGIKGVYITIRLLTDIYKDEGYYIGWDNDDSLLFATRVGDGVTHALVNDVVQELLKRNFFDEGIFKRFKVLTSKAIQKRYSRICKDAKRSGCDIIPKYDALLKVSEVIGITPEEKAITPEVMTKNQEVILQRKVKNSKVKESIEMALTEKLIDWPKVEEYLKFYDWTMGACKRIMEMDKPLTVVEYHRLLTDGYEKELIAKTCIAMHNHKDITRKVSTNLTLRDWMPRQRAGVQINQSGTTKSVPTKQL